MYFDQPWEMKHLQWALSSMADMEADLTFETSAGYFPKGHNEGLKGGSRGLSVEMKLRKADTSV